MTLFQSLQENLIISEMVQDKSKVTLNTDGKHALSPFQIMSLRIVHMYTAPPSEIK